MARPAQSTIVRHNLRVDIASLWDYEQPIASEQRFRAVAATAVGPHRSRLLTQVARAMGIQGRYAHAHALLDCILGDDLEVITRRALERGRLMRGEGSGDLGVEQFTKAADLTESRVDESPFGELHVEALRMLALSATQPDEQVERSTQALVAAQASRDPGAKRLIAALQINLGMAQHAAGDGEAALEAFEAALDERKRTGSQWEIEGAQWLVGWALRLLGRDDEAEAVRVALVGELTGRGGSDGYIARELAALRGEHNPG